MSNDVALQRGRVDWRRAFRAIRSLRSDPERTDQVFELNVALDGGDNERMYATFLAEPQAPALLAARPSLLDRLSDFPGLRRLPADSLGRAYVRLMDTQGFEADGLERAADKIREFAELHPGPERSWFAQRSQCVHDLLHVITGYGQDPAGETALLAFSDGLYSQSFRFRVVRFGLMASVLSAPRRSIPAALAFCARARRRGGRARIPFSFQWEEALPRPLAAVRRELNVASVVDVHRAGILRGTNDAPWRCGPAVC